MNIDVIVASEKIRGRVGGVSTMLKVADGYSDFIFDFVLVFSLDLILNLAVMPWLYHILLAILEEALISVLKSHTIILL